MSTTCWSNLDPQCEEDVVRPLGFDFRGGGLNPGRVPKGRMAVSLERLDIADEMPKGLFEKTLNIRHHLAHPFDFESSPAPTMEQKKKVTQVVQRSMPIIETREKTEPKDVEQDEKNKVEDKVENKVDKKAAQKKVVKKAAQKKPL